jgi:hypothetical protein
MAVRDDFTAGEVLAAVDLNDTFGAKLDLAGGKILQIVRATDTTNRTTTSTTPVDSGLSVTITPSYTNSAIMLICTGYMQVNSGTTTILLGSVRITNSSNTAISGTQDVTMGTVIDFGQAYNSYAIFAWDTPNTISATTYKLRFRSANSGATTQLSHVSTTGQLFAIEVSA